MTRQSLLITSTGMGETSLFLEMGVRRAKRNLLLLMRKRTEWSDRRRAPFTRIQLGNM